MHSYADTHVMYMYIYCLTILKQLKAYPHHFLCMKLYMYLLNEYGIFNVYYIYICMLHIILLNIYYFICFMFVSIYYIHTYVHFFETTLLRIVYVPVLVIVQSVFIHVFIKKNIYMYYYMYIALGSLFAWDDGHLAHAQWRRFPFSLLQHQLGSGEQSWRNQDKTCNMGWMHLTRCHWTASESVRERADAA